MIEFDDYKVKINALRPTLERLGEALKLGAAEEELRQLEEESAQDGFWSDLERSQKVLQRIKQLKIKIDGYKLSSRWDDLFTLCQMGIEERTSLLPELQEEYAAFEKDLEQARLATLLSGEYDNCNAIVSSTPARAARRRRTGRRCSPHVHPLGRRHGMKYKVLDYLDGEAGIKSASIEIEGENAYGCQSESGIHRLVRISPFDASGRRHTSFAAVEVTPLVSDDIEVDIRPEDLKIDTYRSSGAGGQHVNKTESAVRITHLPTGIIVACQMERSQHQNREVAMRMLRSKLIEIKEREKLEKISDIKGEQMKIEWGSQIRSYVFMPYTLVKDHRTGYENGNIGAVMDGDLDGFINAYLTMQAGKE